jgi:hypothetical protein
MLSLAAAAVAFNLICTGTTTATAPAFNASDSYTMVFRIDLATHTYCVGDCSEVYKIHEVRPEILILNRGAESDELHGEHVTVSETIDRQTGKHWRQVLSSKSTDVFKAEFNGWCKQGRFTGFPKRKRKF